MRGKGNSESNPAKRLRITPAYAGKRPSFVMTSSAAWDHPRLCGEKCRCVYLVRFCRGSPPPMRGKGIVTPPHQKGTGITPAYAGKRRRTQAGSASLRDHPRLCGEKAGYWRTPCTVVGSPPPMRGKVVLDRLPKRIVGITPAYAGKRCEFHSVGQFSEDHPRLCGEKHTEPA